MRTHKIALSGLMACLALSGVALATSGCAGNQYHRSAGTYIDDKSIDARVKTALFRDPIVSGFDVHVNSFRGDVQLSGFVDTSDQKAHAAQVAQSVDGVQMVTNNLEVKPGAVGGPGSNVTSSSGTINQPLPNNVAPAPPVNQTPIVNPGTSNVELLPRDLEIKLSPGGMATIRGRVYDQAQSQAIESNVRSLPGVTSIDNRLEVKPAPPIR